MNLLKHMNIRSFLHRESHENKDKSSVLKPL
jgi:hypothetical protein